MAQKSLKKNIILNVMYTITNLVFPLITYPYVARALSASEMGKVTFFSSISGYVTMLAALGIGTYGIRATARVRNNYKKLSKTTSELLFINLILTAIVVLFLCLSFFFINEFNSNAILFFINVIIVIITPFSMDWLFSGLEEYSYITRRNILFKTVSLILVFCLVHNTNDYIVYAAIIAFSTISTYLMNLIFSRRFVKISFNNKMNLRQHIIPMLFLFASILAVSVYTSLDTIMLGFISGNREVGYYGMATKVETILLSAVNAISAALLPRLSNYVGNNEIDKFEELLRKTVSIVFLITIPMTIYFILEAQNSIHFLGGNGYDPAILSMQFLMPILIISGFSNVTGNQILIPMGKDKQFMIAIIVGAITDLALNLFLMPHFKSAGASLATLFAEVAQMFVQLYFARKEIYKNIKIKTLIKSFFSSILAGIIISLLNSSLNLGSFFNLLVTAVVFFGIYGVGLIIVGEEYTIVFLKRLFLNLSKK